MKRVIALLLGAVLGLVLAACTTGAVSTKSDTSKKGSGDTAARVGQPITIKGNNDGSKLQVTVMKVVSTKPTDQFSTVDKGKRLVAVQFKLLNTGTATYDDAPSNGAKVVDAKGQQYEADFVFDKISAGEILPTSIKLAPKNRALGFLVFQIPTKAKIKQIQFSMDSGFGGTAQWNR